VEENLNSNFSEERVNSNLRILKAFGVENKDVRTFSPLALAFLGDGVYEIVVRTLIVSMGNRSPHKLHLDSAKIVKAESQSKSIDHLLPVLTEEEQNVYRRGKNANSPTRAKNASLGDYRKATGYEALLGYLYLKGEDERILELVKIGLEILNY